MVVEESYQRGILSVDPDVACPIETRTTTLGVDSQKEAFRGAWRFCFILLASLWFRRRCSAGRADPRRTEVDGSRLPCFWPWFGRGAVAVFTTPPRSLGDSPPFVKRRGSLPDGVAPVQIIPAGRRSIQLKKPELETAKSRDGVRRPQLVHWPRPARLDGTHNQRPPIPSTRRFPPHSTASHPRTPG